jgi:hypothetical protein
MSESKKIFPILQRATELESLKALLLAFAILCLSNGCKTSSANPSPSLSGRWTGSGVFRGMTNPAIMDFYQTPGGWRAASDQRSTVADEAPKFAPGYLDTMTGWLREQLGLAR